MSSGVVRDLAEVMESIFEDSIKALSKDRTKEELIQVLQDIADDAKEAYATFATSYGWYQSKEEAMEDLEDNQRFLEVTENAPNVEKGYMYKILEIEEVYVRMREWLSTKYNVPSVFIGKVVQESDKSYFIVAEDTDTGFYLPKSQVIEFIR